MSNDPAATQRALVGRRLFLRDGSLLTKYAFPFVDKDWAVPFVTVDLQGGRPHLLTPPLALRDGSLHAEASVEELRPIESQRVERFADLVHLDPWWIFRGIGGVDRAWIEAILASNITGTLEHDSRRLKIHDLTFADGFARAEAIVAKDDTFRVVRLGRGDVDLLSLRPRAKTL